jgi:hypothetical protein
VIPDPAAVLVALREVEREHHRGGWDGAPAVHALRARRGAVAASVALPLRNEVPPGAALAAVAVSMVDAGRPAVPLTGATFAGWAIVSEAWMVEGQERPNVRSLKDAPGRFEIRFAMAADTTGQLYYVQRKRGEAPTAQIIDGGASGVDGMAVDGRLAAALQLMIAATAPYLDGAHAAQWLVDFRDALISRLIGELDN